MIQNMTEVNAELFIVHDMHTKKVCCEERIDGFNAAASAFLLEAAFIAKPTPREKEPLIWTPSILPSRFEHIGILIKNAVIRQPVELWNRAWDIPLHLINNLKEITEPGDRCGKFAYCILSLAILDPLHLLAAVVNTVIRLVATALGILSPSLACQGWRLAAKIDTMITQLKLSARRALVPSCDNKTNGTSYKGQNIDPFSAVSYLGEVRARHLFGLYNARANKGSVDQEPLDFMTVNLLKDAYRLALELKFNTSAYWPTPHDGALDSVEKIGKYIGRYANSKNGITLESDARLMEKLVNLVESYRNSSDDNDKTKELYQYSQDHNDKYLEFFKTVQDCMDNLAKQRHFGRLHLHAVVPTH